VISKEQRGGLRAALFVCPRVGRSALDGGFTLWGGDSRIAPHEEAGRVFRVPGGVVRGSRPGLAAARHGTGPGCGIGLGGLPAGYAAEANRDAQSATGYARPDG